VAKFKKKIVRPGVKTVGRLDGTEEKVPLTPERIKAWADNTNQLRALGVDIPAPFSHQDKNKRFAFPVIKAKDGETLADAYSGTVDGIPPAWDIAGLNAGFWDKFEIDADGDLVGEVEAPGDENDTNTPAGKLGKTVKQTSVFVMPGRTIVTPDGKEHKIGEHMAHVAVCLHAQEPGQDNFQSLSPLSEVPPNLAMSFVLKMDSMGGTPGAGMNDQVTGLPNPNAPQDPELYAVITLLRSALNVALPEDTTRENFLVSLKLVLTQKLADKREQSTEQGIDQRPQDAKVQSPSLAMSQTVATPDLKTDSATIILMNMLLKDKRKSLKDRVNKLVETGRLAKAYAEKNLYPRIDAFKMSASDLTADGSFPTSPVEDLISGLEEAIPLAGPSLLDQGAGTGAAPSGAELQDLPADIVVGVGEVADVSQDDFETIAAEMNL
jgi:hypothetical protein